MQLSVYLFDQRIKSLEGVKKRAEEAEYEAVEVNSGVADVAAFERIFYHRPPDWVQWVAPWVAIDESKATGTSLALILFLLVEERVFAVPFGFGHMSIDKEILERDFGFQAALRFLKPTELSLIDIRNVDKRTRQKRSSLSFRGTIQEFDVAIDNELAFKIAGNSEDEAFGKRIVGGTSFAFDSKDAIDVLRERCSKLLKSLEEPVKRDFEQVNPYKTEKDEAVLRELDEWLIGCLKDRRLDSISVAVPELEVTLAAQYRLARGRDHKPVSDLVIEHVVEALLELCGDAVDMGGVSVTAYDADDRPISKQSYLLRDCLVAQRESEGKGEVIYVLSLGKWHSVKRSFIEDIERDVERIGVIEQDGYLPPFAHDNEGHYNKSVAGSNADKFVCLDKDLFREGLKTSSVEVCDLYSHQRHLVCVKSYHASQSMSHLFSQGLVSAKFLKNHREYRQELAKKIGSVGQFDLDSFSEGDFTFVYAVIMDAKKSLPGNLPFFSKVRLLEDTRTIKGMGFNVKLYHIPLTPIPAKDLGGKDSDGNGSRTKPLQVKKVKAAIGKPH